MTTDTSNTKVGNTAVLFVVVLSSFLAPFMMSAINVALPVIGERFALDAVALGWIVTSYILACAVFMLPCGRAGDIWGRKRIFLWGMIVYSIGSLFSAIAPTAGTLIAARVINGVGAAMSFATGMAILMSVVRPTDRGTVLGWNVAAVYLGLSLGPVLGGFIAHNLGWRWIFGLNAAAGLVVVAFTVWKMKGEWADAKGERFDIIGSIVYGLMLVSFMYGASLLPRARGAVLLLVSVAGFAGFVRWERRTRSPLFDVDLFRGNAVFALANLAALINYSATAAVGFLLSLYLEYTRGLTPQEAGLVLIAQPVVMTLFSPMAGRLSDRVAPRKLAALGMAFTAAGLAAFCFLRQDTGLWIVAAGLAILGFGFALFSSPNTNAVMSSVEPKYYGIASGTLSTMRVVGQMLSMAVVMLIMTLFLGHVRISAEHYPQFGRCLRWSFAVFAVLCVLGVFASSVRGKTSSSVSPRVRQ